MTEGATTVSARDGRRSPAPEQEATAVERPARRGPYRNGIRTREQIIAQAMTAFSQRGFHGSSARQIAAAVGISPAALQRHFGSKDELLSAVLASWALQTADAQGSEPGQGLEHWTSQHRVMQYHVAHRGLLQLFIRFASEASDPDHPARAFMVPRYEGLLNVFAGELVRAAERGQIAPITPDEAMREARSLFAFMDGIEIQWLLDPDVNIVAEFDAYLAHTIARLRGPVPPGEAALPGSDEPAHDEAAHDEAVPDEAAHDEVASASR